MAKQLPRQIDGLKQKILFVGTLVEEAIAKAITALNNRDRNLANAVIEEDAEIDRMEVDVEEECLKVLALYQPVAADLRFVVAVLKINNDLERMGDLAKNIAKRVVFLANCEPFDLPVDYRPMATRAKSMVKESLDALVPDLLPAVPPDRLDGQPLRYALRDGKPVVYSIGMDHDDDRGRGIDTDAYTWGALSFVPLKPGWLRTYRLPENDGDWILWPPRDKPESGGVE